MHRLLFFLSTKVQVQMWIFASAAIVSHLLLPRGTVLIDEVKIQWIITDSRFLRRKETYNEFSDAAVPRLRRAGGDDFLWLFWLTLVSGAVPR